MLMARRSVRYTKGALKAKGPADAFPVRVRREDYEAATELVKTLSQNGWKSVGIEREDAPSIAAVVSEGIRLLAAKAKR